MGRMLRGVVLALLAPAALADLAFREAPTACKALQCSVAVPQGWAVHQQPKALVVIGERGGFKITWELFLREPADFMAAWQSELRLAGVNARVEPAKAGKHDAWRATWDAAGRRIEVYRVRVPETEMLYNVSFSGIKGDDLSPLVNGVLSSFACTAPKPELRFQKTAEAVSTRVSMRLPEGFAKSEEKGGFVQTVRGYKEPHEAGWIAYRDYDAGVTYGLPNGQAVGGGDVEKLAEISWEGARAEIGTATKKPRGKAARIAGGKGHVLEGPVLSKNGIPKRVVAFAFKLKQSTIVVVMALDERLLQLHKDFVKEMIANVEARD
jgi:hypothetical protein